MSCLVSESIIENRVRGERGGRRRKKRKRARGGKSGSLLETLVERCLTGTCCWWHTNEYLPLLSAACTLARPRCSSCPLSPSLASLRSFRGARYFIPPACHCTCLPRLPRVSFIYEEARRTRRVGENCKGGNDKFIICMKSKMDLVKRSRTCLTLAFPPRVVLLN